MVLLGEVISVAILRQAGCGGQVIHQALPEI